MQNPMASRFLNPLSGGFGVGVLIVAIHIAVAAQAEADVFAQYGFEGGAVISSDTDASTIAGT